MSEQSMRTEDELALIDSVLGEHYLNERSRAAFVKAAVLDCERRQLVQIMESFDAFCEAHGVRYFTFGKCLNGIVSYGDFLPDSAFIDLGMPRGDYEVFSAACRGDALASMPWSLQESYSGRLRRIRRVRPLLKSKESQRVRWKGNYLFDDDSMPIEVCASIEICIFDEVPDDFFTRKKFFRQMERRNKLIKKSLAAREYMRNYPDEEFDSAGKMMDFERMNWGRAFLRCLIPARLVVQSCWRKAKKYQGSGAANVACVMYSRSKTCPVSDLGAMPHRDFAGIRVRTPERPDLWAREPIMETTPELRRLQDCAKTIVQEIDRICGELGIEYFACGGTMLGYVRHGGFIPWDDDIDIGMFRADYERFKAEAGAVIDSERFFLQTRETDPNIPYLFSKVRMNGTEYLTDYNVDRDFHKGICVDVFPFDYIPNEGAAQRAFRNRMRTVERRHNHVVNRQYPEPDDIHPKKNLDWAIGQVVGRVLARYYWSLSLDDTQAAYDDAVTTYDRKAEAGERFEFVASFVPTYTMARVDDLKPFQRVMFDGIELNLPAHPEIFLSMQYGDYMTMPYPHQRTGHDLLLWSDEAGIGGGRFANEAGAET